MTSRYVDDGRGGALGHEPLRVRRDHSVVLRDEIPSWLGFPGRHADRAGECVDTLGQLRVSHERGFGRWHVGGERFCELLAVEKHESVLRRQKRRDRRARQRVF
jgi:hypothetical protein